ncbi:hypothetical protein EZS27_024476 [termite gut metagenome]|uniref:Uncharacterized protein n=1 Tax=termite gut metagenome TaxID=433724 RepID=A0A5J4R070_9ZZZZ
MRSAKRFHKTKRLWIPSNVTIGLIVLDHLFGVNENQAIF